MLDRIKALGPGRKLIAIAGPPGAGKSTLAARIARQTGAALVPMDGFHLDNRLLDSDGLRAQKGAPETFDVAGLVALVRRLRGPGTVVFPLLDRDRDLAIAGAGRVLPEIGPVIVEGNYLLLDRPIWRELSDLWDLSLMLDVPDAILRQRLAARWRDLGCDDTSVEAHLRNDLANAAIVQSQSRGADLVMPWDETP